jgi:hypothetical protein
MAKKPPPLPSEILSRVLNVATFDGRLLMIVAGTLAVLHAMANDGKGALVGILVAGAGALELHGAGLLRAGYAQGMSWLVRSQLLLLATMLLFAATQLMRPPQEVLNELRRSSYFVALFDQSPLPLQLQSAQLINALSFSTVGFVTLIYQGAMAAFYHRRRKSVALALQEDDAGDELDLRQ